MSSNPRSGELAARTHTLLIEAVDAGQARRQEILDEVVTSHLWLALALSRRFSASRAEADDLGQVANSALVEAVHRFDPQHGVFVGFATPTIIGVLKRHLRDHSWLVRPSRHVQEVTIAIRRQRPALMQEIGAEPTDRDLAERLGEPLDVIRSARVAERGCTGVSLESSIGYSRSADDSSEHDRHRTEANVMIGRLLAGLPHEELRLLQLRFVQERSQADIAADLGTSQMQISRMLSRLLIRLRAQLGELDQPCLSA